MRRLSADPVYAHKVSLLLCDVIAVTIAFFASFLVRNKLFRVLDWEGTIYRANPRHLIFLAFFICIVFFVFRHQNLYKRVAYKASFEHAKELFKSWVVTLLIFVSLAFFGDTLLFLENRLTVVFFGLFGMVGLMVGRFMVVGRLFQLFDFLGLCQNPILIIGAGARGRKLGHQLQAAMKPWDRFVGYVDDDPAKIGTEVSGLPVLASTVDLAHLVEEHQIREVFVGISDLAPDQLTRIIALLRPLPIRPRIAVESFGEVRARAQNVGQVDANYFFIDNSQLRGLDAMFKRLIDFAGSSLGLLVLLPLFLILAVLIKTTSKGPVFFKQLRGGKDGKPFWVYKFRSMSQNTEEHHKKATAAFMDGDTDFFVAENEGKANLFKATDSAFVTPVGQVLRRYSLDELPQLINVWKGEMSMIGPRPEPLYHVDLYQSWHRSRFAVKPGMTGFWQVYGRSEVTHDDMVLMDIFYIENWSLALDFKILFKTPIIMFTGRGAV